MAKMLGIGAEDAVARCEAEIVAAERGLAALRGKLDQELGREARAAEAERQRVEDARQERIKVLVERRVEAAGQIEKAIQEIDAALASYAETAEPVRDALGRHEVDRAEALNAGQHRCAGRLGTVLLKHDVVAQPWMDDPGPLDQAERASLDWWPDQHQTADAA